MKQRIAGIKRATKFSPNHIDNDAMIMEMTGKVLRQRGFDVSFLYEDEVEQEYISDKVIFSMARSEPALNYLEHLERDNVSILNSVNGVRNCHRENMMNNFARNGVRTPKYHIVSTEDYKYSEEIASQFSAKKLWIKRDGHINHREDIVEVFTPAELGNVLKEFLGRNILRACVMEHIEGDEIKFYAVPQANYWHWYYSNGNKQNPLNLDFLKNEIYRCADIFDLDFYGGDAIIDKNGEIYFIDLNDWPSFAPIRNNASTKIADVIIAKMNRTLKSKYSLSKEF
jgi:glutathione synthase/RimK-type ligase-like ATP-grasp enzyme